MNQRLVIEARSTSKVIREVPIAPGPDGNNKLVSLLARFPETRFRRYWSTDCNWGGGHRGMR